MKSRFMNVASVALVSMVSAAACGASLTLGEPNLVGDQLTVPVTVGGYSGGTLELLIGEAGPRDGEPDATTSAASLAITEDGTYNLTAQVSVGAKIAYRAALGSDDSLMGVITATDSSEYIWVNNAKGNWHDPANWTRKETATDGYKNIGYPAYTTGQVRFLGGQTAEVTLDADYSCGELFLDNTGLNLTVMGSGKTISCGNTHTTGGNTLVFDNVKVVTSGSYTVAAGSRMRMINGAYFETKWEFNVNGDGAYLYVGPGCEIYASNGYWWTFRLDGEGALVEVDDGYIRSRGFRIGQQSSSGTPKGFILKGKNPRLEFEQEFVVCSSIPSSPLFELVVPRGGYAAAPIKKTRDGKFPMCGPVWQDHEDDTTVRTPVAFGISASSPFYADETICDMCVVDWSSSNVGIADAGFVLRDTVNDSTTDYLYTKKANASCQTSQDQVWAFLTGRGEIERTLVDAETESVGAGDLTGSITLTGNVGTYVDDGVSTVELRLAWGGPKDDLSSNMEVVEEKPVSAVGAVSFTRQVPLGAKVAYAIVARYEIGGQTWYSSSNTNLVKVLDSASFAWKANTTGYWSEPANWTMEGECDGKTRLGYPSYGCMVNWYGNQTDVIYVDANYELLAGNGTLGWGGADLTFIGTVEDAAISSPWFKDAQYSGVAVTFDGVALTYVNKYCVKDNSSLTMRNGASIKTQWEFTVAGENAYMYLGTNCHVAVSKKEDWHRFELSGKDAEIVIDNGTVDALYLGIAESSSGQSPKGITFMGRDAQLAIRDSNGERTTGIKNAIPESPVFRFVIPAGGFASAPIVRTGNGGATFFARDGEGVPAVTFVVDKASPYLKSRGKFDQQLVDWSTSAAQTKLDTAGITLTDMPRSSVSHAQMYFTPKSDAAKSGVACECRGSQGMFITLR